MLAWKWIYFWASGVLENYMDDFHANFRILKKIELIVPFKEMGLSPTWYPGLFLICVWCLSSCPSCMPISHEWWLGLVPASFSTWNLCPLTGATTHVLVTLVTSRGSLSSQLSLASGYNHVHKGEIPMVLTVCQDRQWGDWERVAWLGVAFYLLLFLTPSQSITCFDWIPLGQVRCKMTN